MPPPGPPDQSRPDTLTAAQAKEMDWQNKLVKFDAPYGAEYIGYLLGWTEQGFILKDGNKIDTLSYKALSNWISVETDKRNTAGGARTGCFVGSGCGLLFFLVANDDINKNKSEFTGFAYIILGVTIPVIIGISTGLGALIGAHTHKYQKYFISDRLFRDNPCLLPGYYDQLFINEK
jgi:hypothetical protein